MQHLSGSLSSKTTLLIRLFSNICVDHLSFPTKDNPVVIQNYLFKDLFYDLPTAYKCTLFERIISDITDYSGISEQRTLWDQYKFKWFVPCIEVVLLRDSNRIIGGIKFGDLILSIVERCLIQCPFLGVSVKRDSTVSQVEPLLRDQLQLKDYFCLVEGVVL